MRFQIGLTMVASPTWASHGFLLGSSQTAGVVSGWKRLNATSITDDTKIIKITGKLMNDTTLNCYGDPNTDTDLFECTAAMNTTVGSNKTTSFVVEENDMASKKWALVTLQEPFHLVSKGTNAFHSPIDLCQDYLLSSQNRHNAITDMQSCLETLQNVALDPLRCIISSSDASPIKAIGVEKHPSFASVMSRVDWGRAMLLLTVVIFMTYTGICTKRRKNQYPNNVLYLILMGVVICFTTEVDGWYSGTPISTIAIESYNAFVNVHPMESWLIAMSHFGSYWFYIGSWRSKSLRNMLIWQFLIESVTASVNELTHHMEEQNAVRCMRIAFIGAVKNYAVDNIIRVYILPPFFVFGYLLPKFVYHWICVGLELFANNA